MPDERMESIRQGIAAPEESEQGKRADADRERRIAQMKEADRPESAMGGTSDSDSAADEAAVNAVRGDRS